MYSDGLGSSDLSLSYVLDFRSESNLLATSTIGENRHLVTNEPVEFVN